MQEHAVLRITNNEFNKDVSFDCLFQKLPFLEVKAEPTVLKPNESVDVPIIFTPREVKTYLEQVPFELNGLYTVNISVAGEVRIYCSSRRVCSFLLCFLPRYDLTHDI